MQHNILSQDVVQKNKQYFQNYWHYMISDYCYNIKMSQIEKYQTESYLSNDANNLLYNAVISMAADKTSNIYKRSYKQAELAILIASMAIDSEDKIAYGEGYGDNVETVLIGRYTCKKVLAYANWILNNKPDSELFLQYSKALELYLLHIKFKADIIDDVSKPLYVSGNKNALFDLFIKYMKNPFCIKEITVKPIKKYSTFLYYLSHFVPMSIAANENLIISSSIKYFYKLAIDWRTNRQIYFDFEERMVIGYIYGQYVNGRTAPSDFMQDIRGF